MIVFQAQYQIGFSSDKLLVLKDMEFCKFQIMPKPKGGNLFISRKRCRSNEGI